MLRTGLLKYFTKPTTATDISEIRNYLDARDIGILFTENTEGMKSFKHLETELLNDQKNIFPLMRVQKPDKDKTYTYPFYIAQDVSLFGKLKSATLQKYTSRSLDMLLILDEKPDTLTQFVVSKCKCPLRIGLSTSPELASDLLNFIVKPKKEEKKHRALLDYLRMIS